MTGSTTSRNLESARVRMAIVRTGLLLSLEGVSRASAAEISERTNTEFNISQTPAEIGQALLAIGVCKAVTHGKSRFVLDRSQLEEIVKRIESHCRELITKLETTREDFKELPKQIDNLRGEWQKIIKLEARKRELNELITETRQQLSSVPYLEDQWRSIQQEAKRAIDLDNEVKALTAKIKELPTLEQKKTTLEEGIRKYNTEEYQLRAREASLGRALQEFKERNAWADLHTLNYNIQLKQTELDQISKQLGEKRSLLARLLNRNGGVSR
jgi:DNA repair exonuclease SbcCD ATPase subunit